jgi:hypothetical protein
MAQRITRDLYLQVGGNVAPLQVATKAGKSALLELGGAAGDVAEIVERAFADMAANAPASAKALETSYMRTFSAIRSNAQAVLAAPTPGAALQILDAGAADQAATAAEAQAAALRQVATASAAVAQRAGEAADAERVLAVAAAANATQAEQEAVALRAQANVLGAVRGELVSMGVVQKTAVVRNEQHRQSMMMAGQQAQDFAVQVGSGQSPVTAFTQQIGQLAFAVQGMGGKMEGVASFLTSGWGIAATIAVTVLAPLIGKVLEHSDALQDETDKLKDNAEKAAVADRAKQAFLATEAGAIDDVRALTDEIKKQNEALLTNAERLNIRAKNRLEFLQSRRDDAASDLADARDALRSPPSAGGVAGTSAMIQGQAEEKVRNLEARLRNLDAWIAKANTARAETQKDLALDAAKRAVDPLEAIRYRYEGQGGLIDLAQRHATAQEAANGVLFRRLELLKQQQRVETEAEQKRQSAARRSSTPSAASQSNLGDMTALLKTVLPGVRITATTNGKHVPGSDHYASRAIDFVPAGGMGSISKADMRELLVNAGVNIRRNANGTEQFFGPGDKGHADHFHVAWTGGVKSTDDLAKADDQRARVAEAARLKRERDEETYAQMLLRAQEDAVQLRRAQVVDIAAAADLDVQAVEIERQRLASAADAGVTQKRWTQAKADDLKAIYAANAQTKASAIRDRQSQQLLDQQLDQRRDELTASSTMLQLQADLAVTDADRRRIALQLLANDEEMLRLQAVRLMGSTDPRDQAKGEALIKQGEEQHAGKVAQIERQTAGPMDRYRQQLHEATDDMTSALEGVEARGFQTLEDGMVGLIDGTESVGSAFKRMASSIIADLARIAIQKAILGAIPGAGSLFGFIGGKANGGKIEGRAGGGKISGPGTGTSDSILALIDGAKPLMVSNGESIVTAEATSRYWPIIDAMNKGTLPGLATGGAIGAVRMPRLPDIGTARREVAAADQQRVVVEGDIRVSPTAEFDARMERLSFRTVSAAAEPIMAGSQARTMRALQRQSLPGAPG